VTAQHAKPSVIIGIPCYNEADRLAVETLIAFQLPQHRVELVFVNDGSRDGTLRVLEDMRTRAPERIGVVDLVRNSGKAEAVRQGIVHALERSPDYIGFWDADLATPLTELAPFCDILDTRPAVQMVLGSRVRLMGRAIERKPYRHYFGRVFATAASLVSDLPVYDTQCGAKLFRVSDTLRQVFATPFLSRWVFDVEIITRFWVAMAAHGVEIGPALYEMPLREWRDVGGSKVHLTDAVQAFVDLARIRRDLACASERASRAG
jgi:glycosyltransferase involved in cell wall biosynthesis